MATDTVNYRAKSVAKSWTIIFNVLATIGAILGADELKALLGPQALTYVTATITAINVILRMWTVRPVAFVAPGNSKPVAVAKLD